MRGKSKYTMEYSMLLIDYASIIIAYALALNIRYANEKLNTEMSLMHTLVAVSCLLFYTIYQLIVRWRKTFLDRDYLTEMKHVVMFSTTMFVFISVFLVLTKYSNLYSRLVLFYFTVAVCVIMYIANCTVKYVLRKYFTRENVQTKVMVVTIKTRMREAVENLRDSLGFNYELTMIACLDAAEDELGTEYEGIQIKANRQNLMDVAKLSAIDAVFMDITGEPEGYAESIINDFNEMGVACHYNIGIHRMPKIQDGKMERFGAYTVVSYSMNHANYRMIWVKRIVDILGGTVGLLITALLTPFIALAIRLDSPGPIFFCQTRIGKNGRRFKFYKFRSMYIDAEERKKELMAQNEVKGLMFKMENDPRITPVGRFLRKTSLDELPQFYNILVGDMSLIGTRPPTTDEFEKYNLYYRRRLSMTPGLTGMWQISGRSDISDFDEVVRLDLEYIDNWSLLLDIKILFQTVKVVCLGKGSR